MLYPSGGIWILVIMDTKTYRPKRSNDKRLYFRIHWRIDYCPYINKIFNLYISKEVSACFSREEVDETLL